MPRSRLRLDLKPLVPNPPGDRLDGLPAPRQAWDTAAQWWLTETDGPDGPQRWEFGSRSELDAHLATRGLSPEQIDDLWAQQEIPLEDHQAVADPLWLRDSAHQHVG
jgi:hypothetical protein